VCNYSRNIKKAPERILDAPALQDDFYFDIVDWSPTNFISIGLINHVYYLNATTNKSSKMATYHEPNALVSCLKSNPLGDILAVGTTNGDIDLFDFDKEKNLRKIHGHTGRVGALSWKDNLIASGSRDGHILVTDIRSKKDYQIKLQSHRQEICGLSFNCFDSLLASGGNDNKVVVWDITKGEEYLRMTEHTAAVKALAWSPHQSGLLASGGGSTDKTIKLWNVKLNRIEKSVDTGSQVCALRFSKSVNEMVSTHGFSQN
jgi:cell division cycle 20-like protein 1 (cofactor of APC complex)